MWVGGVSQSFKLRLEPKKLKSGKCQVKFFASIASRPMYGYMLTNADDSLKRVVATINGRLSLIASHADFRHLHLYSLAKENRDFTNMLIFEI